MRDPRRAGIAIFLMGGGLLGAGCDDDGLKPALTPTQGQRIPFYRIGNLRCPYWVPAFRAADGRNGGYQCVNRVTLRKMCAIGDCEQEPGTPSDLPPSLIDRSKGGPGWKATTKGAGGG